MLGHAAGTKRGEKGAYIIGAPFSPLLFRSASSKVILLAKSKR